MNTLQAYGVNNYKFYVCFEGAEVIDVFFCSLFLVVYMILIEVVKHYENT